MWKLLKAGLEYHRGLFITLYAVVAAAAVLNAFARNLTDDLARLMLFSLGAIGVVAGTEAQKNRTNRLETALPLPIGQVFLSGTLMWIGYWISMMILLWLSALVAAGGRLGVDFLWYVIALTGMTVGWISCMGIQFESPFYFRDKRAVILVRIVSLVVVLAYILLYLFLVGYGDGFADGRFIRFWLEPGGALLLMGLGVLSLGAYARVFLKRWSYTE